MRYRICKKLLLIIFLSFSLVSIDKKELFSQGIPIGQWRHHLPTNTIVSLVETPARMIGTSSYGLVIYNRNDNSIERFNKIHGLTDVGISLIEYDPVREILFIAYENGNIDLKQNNHVYNLPDIRRASIIGSKRINNIYIRDDRAFLATGFGIVNLNLEDHTIRDTYYIGPEGSQIIVNDLMFTDKHIYAATEGGIFMADIDAPNLADYNYWDRMEDLPSQTANYTFILQYNNYIFANTTTRIGEEVIDTVYYHDGEDWNIFQPYGDDYFHKKRQIKTSQDRLIIVTESFVDVFNSELELQQHVDNYYDGTPNPYDALVDNEGYLWIGDSYHGMVKMTSSTSSDKVRVRGPSSASSFALASSAANVWVAPGAKSSSGLNYWNYHGFLRFADERWHSYNRFSYNEMEGVFDIVNVATDPRNPVRVAACSWNDGVLLFEDFELIGKYGMDNRDEHTLQPRIPHSDWIRISSSVFDRNGNLWIANSQVANPLSVRKTNGEWLSFNLDGLVNSSWRTGNMIIDDSNQKWIILPRGNGIVVFKENSLDSSSDYEVKHITTRTGRGGLPSNDVTAIAEDHNGYIWVATSAGVVVFYSPHRVLTGEPVDAHAIVLEEDRFAGLLFENETVNSITIDGSNKKWFGTSRAGAFLMTADAQRTIHHFDIDNSPLPSNNVRDIAVEPKTGEVFFATERGMASYRGYATEGQLKHSDVFAFPNPVRPGYEGYIAVNGLVSNANVKITDINGNLVYETIAEGGQAVWDGRDMRGKRPGSGVYLVFSTNEDGSETVVTKILFLN